MAKIKSFISKPITKRTENFIRFLEGRLIPDLYDSGHDATANDFETAVTYMKYWMDTAINLDRVYRR